MAYISRTLPLVLVECCTRYLVSELHWCPPCARCEQTPQYVGDTAWWLEFQDAG